MFYIGDYMLRLNALDLSYGDLACKERIFAEVEALPFCKVRAILMQDRVQVRSPNPWLLTNHLSVCGRQPGTQLAESKIGAGRAVVLIPPHGVVRYV